MRDRSKQIALSAMSAALATVFLVAGKFIPVLELSAYMLAEIAMLLPLTKKYYTSGFLACLAAAALTLLFVGGDFLYVMPFALFFGFHPLVTELFIKFRVKKIIAFIIKAVWFCGTVFLMYFFTELFIADKNLITQFIDKYYFIAIPVFSVLFFAFYDWFIERAFRSVKIFTQRLNF